MSQQKFLKAAKTTGLVLLGLGLAMKPAMAHHPFGGNTPANFIEGFLSGLAHPVIGIDHLAFVIAVGLLAAGIVRGAWIPAAFLITAMAGTGLHVLGVNLPLVEMAVAISAITLGAILILEKHPNFTVLAALSAVAGLFHGYAYGEAIIGADMSSLVAYLTGFTLIQYAIALVALKVGISIGTTKIKRLSFTRLCGAIICAIGMIFLAGSVVG